MSSNTSLFASVTVAPSFTLTFSVTLALDLALLLTFT